jgi:hypothetical protein
MKKSKKKKKKKKKNEHCARGGKVEQVCHSMFVGNINKQQNYISKNNFNISIENRSIGSVNIINNSNILAQQLANVTNAKRTEA